MKDNSTISQELLENVERYFNDTMLNEERTAFENKLKSDEKFKLQVEDMKTLLLGIESQSLKEQLEEFHKDIPLAISKNTSSKHKLSQFFKYAVAAVLVIGLGSFWYFQKPSNEKLYVKYFVADPGLPTTMSANENFEFYDAMVNYKHGDYKIAISKWEKQLQKKPDNDTINYFLGVAQLADNNENMAINYLKNTTKFSESIFIKDAHFYLGLAYLKTNQQSRAKESFKFCNNKESKEILTNLK